MKPAPFKYHSPSTLPEALACLADIAEDDGRVLAGGQSLLPSMAYRLAKPRHLLDINRIDALARLTAADNAVQIGACVRHSAFHRPVTADPLGRLLQVVVSHIAHYPIRTRGTFCGSLAMADPASEWCCVAATLDAELTLESIRGVRKLRASQFFEGFMTTSLESDEVLTSARLPFIGPNTRFGFQEFSRRRGDYALSMALVTLRLSDGQIAEARIGIGGAEGAPRRLAEAEAALSNERPSNRLFKEAAEIASDSLEPLEDATTSAEYRRELVQALIVRAFQQAMS